MVKTADRFPIVEPMALRAILAQASAMCIFVASEAVAGEPKEGTIQILLLKPRALRRGNVSRVMALLAGQRRVLTLQPVARLAVIEGLFRRLPMDELELQAVVLRVAASALFVVGFLQQGGVVAAVCRNALGDFGVALQALELLVAACNPVAGSAIGGPAEG